MTSCNCPNPPGGVVNCPDDHTAVCRVVGGQAVSECLPPDDDLDGEAQAVRIVEIVTGTKSATGRLTPTDRAILASGSYVSPDGKMKVTFQLPSKDAGGGRPAVAGYTSISSLETVLTLDRGVAQDRLRCSQQWPACMPRQFLNCQDLCGEQLFVGRHPSDDTAELEAAVHPDADRRELDARARTGVRLHEGVERIPASTAGAEAQGVGIRIQRAAGRKTLTAVEDRDPDGSLSKFDYADWPSQNFRYARRKSWIRCDGGVGDGGGKSFTCRASGAKIFIHGSKDLPSTSGSMMATWAAAAPHPVLHRGAPPSKSAVRETPDFKGLLRSRESVAERVSVNPH
jgi:hypothetical protein